MRIIIQAFISFILRSGIRLRVRISLKNIVFYQQLHPIIDIIMKYLLTHLILLTYFVPIYTDLITLQYQPDQYQIMYSGSSSYQEFQSHSNLWVCQSSQLFTVNQTKSQYETNEGYNVLISGFNINLTVQVTSRYQLLVPSANQTQCPANQNCTIQILNNCPHVNYFHYFDVIQIYIEGIQALSSTPLSFNVICDDSMPRNSFTWGQIVLIFIATAVISVTALFSRAWSYHNAGFQINFAAVILITVLLAIGFSFVLSGVQVLLDIITYSVIFFSFTIGSLSVMFVVSQILFLFPSGALHKGLYLKIFTFRYMDMIGLVLGIGLTTAWWLTQKNFLLSDAIDLCILVALIKLIKFTSLKIAVILYLSTSALMIVFIAVIEALFSISYEEKLQSVFYSPFLFTIPTLTPVPNQQCSALYMLSLVYPGMLLSYIRRFDLSRSSGVYTITFIICFVVLSLVWSIVNVVSPFIIPFNLMTIPVGLVTITLFSNRRNELNVLWHGNFQDEEYKHSKTHIAELMEVVKKEKTPSQLTFKKSLLKGLQFRDSNSSRAFSFFSSRSQSTNQQQHHSSE